MLPVMKVQCIEALMKIRENVGLKPISKDEYNKLRSEGKSDKEIAKILKIDPSTLQRRKKKW